MSARGAKIRKGSSLIIIYKMVLAWISRSYQVYSLAS